MNEVLYTKEQTELLKMVRNFAENEIMSVSKDCDVEGRFPLEVYKKAFEMGAAMVESK